MGRRILVADLLCGAGGSSTGCAQALAELGLELDLVCVNHWPVAIDTHTRNHPQARHYCQDIATVRPLQAAPEGRLDLLMASPSCTHHSIARGGRPTSDQQRSDPWHIIAWLTDLDVANIIIENVWEFTKWGPVDPATGKPIKGREGQYFNLWIFTLRSLGYEPEWRKLNAADYGEATTRQRFILFAKKGGRPPIWPAATHGKGRARAWTPARDIIDWSIKGRSIFNRKKPLAAKTLARIHAGAVKFGWPEPFLVILRNHMAGQSVDGPLPTIAAGGSHIALAQPIIVKQHFRRDSQSLEDPAPTITAVSRIGLVEAFILNRHGDGYGEVRAHALEDPAPTANCDGGGYLVEPFVLSRHGEGAPRSVAEPTPTQVAKHSHCLISPYYGYGWQGKSGKGDTSQTADQPLPTVTAKARFGMVVPITHSCSSNRARDVDRDPLPTLTTAHRGEQALVEATPQYDILFRMLEPHELAAAMGFNDDDAAYEFAGTKTERIKQIGNAVSVKLMKACVTAMLSDLAQPLAEAAE